MSGYGVVGDVEMRWVLCVVEVLKWDRWDGEKWGRSVYHAACILDYYFSIVVQTKKKNRIPSFWCYEKP